MGKKCQSSIRNGAKRSNLNCNCSGKKRLAGWTERQRMVKAPGSCKLNDNCTSSMVVKESNGKVSFVYYKCHYKHDNNLAHVTLPDSAKRMNADNLMKDIPTNKILE